MIYGCTGSVTFRLGNINKFTPVRVVSIIPYSGFQELIQLLYAKSVNNVSCCISYHGNSRQMFNNSSQLIQHVDKISRHLLIKSCYIVLDVIFPQKNGTFLCRNTYFLRSVYSGLESLFTLSDILVST